MSAERKLRSIENEAADAFVASRYGKWTTKDQAALKARLQSDPAYADAYRRVEESWSALGAHAETPEVMAYREEAIAYARRSSMGNGAKWSRRVRHQWRAAAVITGATLALAIAWQFSPYGYEPNQYHTGIGEQRIIELDDRSRIALDADTQLHVHFSNQARVVQLMQGQAQFSVAKDPSRTFKVQAGDHTIIALGTVFTVEYIDGAVHVTTLEGKVAVLSPRAGLAVQGSPNPPAMPVLANVPSDAEQRAAIQLSAGEEVRVDRDGRTAVSAEADLEAATAWREGKVVFRTVTLSEAVRRLNRYSLLKIEIADETLASKHISGVFEAGDTRGFVSAVERYLPVTAEYADSDTITLSSR